MPLCGYKQTSWNRLRPLYIIQFSQVSMVKSEFISLRKKLEKTQKEVAALLGVSIKAVHSYEQGWRGVPAHVERQMFFMVASKENRLNKRKPCWLIKNCPSERKRRCPAFEFHAGKICWFINGTVCDGRIQQNWKKKMEICRSCEVLTSLL